ncbi:D-TA family PLP-dependent enzyme [Hyalangium rubrum]|uniref:D-TA family PLP-dependent enzyme n=1 Tax=Hyalangium rubrum TaxID=3103134 RepID=A0ABU5H6K3_9BACT|nr:D-TA family PLP-dependent enzyme [Hyalangium sp. s54d21]MDY7229100.1 D-TA family PLP-dependent enzyme [Hyalangium sp. s54d21]
METPAALVDMERVEANLRRVHAYADQYGLKWRPHTKTHKVPELTALQLQAGASGVTVATPHEAEVMASVADDIFLAYPPVGTARLARLMRLPPRVRLSVGLDSREALQGLNAAAREAGRKVGVLVELDLGMRRVGVQTPQEALVLARAIQASEALEYRGITFYPGHVRALLGDQDAALKALSTELGEVVGELTRADLRPEVVSGGSTPTLWRSHEVVGLTEIRPGINIFNDRNTASVGACGWDEWAYSVLATVVSTAVPGQAVIDAGSKALAKEEGFAPGGGYGVLLEWPEVVVRGLSEEHGLLDLTETEWRPRVGDRVRVVPNHVCASVNLHERLWAVRGGEVERAWPVAARGWGTPERQA